MKVEIVNDGANQSVLLNVFPRFSRDDVSNVRFCLVKHARKLLDRMFPGRVKVSHILHVILREFGPRFHSTGSILALEQSRARSTATAATPVNRSEFVPTFAMSTRTLLSSVFSHGFVQMIRCISSDNIGSMRYRLKMSGIHAGPVATKVVNLSAEWNWPDFKFIGNAMRPNGRPVSSCSAAHPKTTIAIPVQAANPCPAFGLLPSSDVSPKAIRQVHSTLTNRVSWSHVTTEFSSLVVSVTPAMRAHFSIAGLNTTDNHDTLHGNVGNVSSRGYYTMAWSMK